jgi:hypothetical protein
MEGIAPREARRAGLAAAAAMLTLELVAGRRPPLD